MLRENAEEGKSGGQSGFSGGVGGASQAVFGTVELTVPPHTLAQKKKKKKKKPAAAVSTAPVVVCCGVLQHGLAASRAFLPPGRVSSRNM